MLIRAVNDTATKEIGELYPVIGRFIAIYYVCQAITFSFNARAFARAFFVYLYRCGNVTGSLLVLQLALP